jgi:cell division cycle 2-like protein
MQHLTDVAQARVDDAAVEANKLQAAIAAPPSPAALESSPAPPPVPPPARRRVRQPLLDGCRSVDAFERLDKIEEGSYGVVYRARDVVSREIVALKRVKLTREACVDGFPITALRETNVLLALQHENIVAVKEMVVGREHDKVFMVRRAASRNPSIRIPLGHGIL